MKLHHNMEKQSSQPFYFYILSVGVTLSSFSNIGKMTAWNTWPVFSDVTSLFVELPKLSEDIKTISQIERFVVLLYKRTSPIKDVNTARVHFFRLETARLIIFHRHQLPVYNTYAKQSFNPMCGLCSCSNSP